ncbi:hypothetical protein JJD26997_2030 [Campylobacter jejuni subsp. doylei 269.97]|uniref:Uncharacterized protein n=1 Tax=Campylobacter jejuni subsp. doylei (strain ATCC BAA-1458 / RM4099 / 269.97) TaxID=360109 RepID=A7H612_CAMJD|nr:hypothetical protein JJD26997_2030 [Campylobacter jejuni subsp. doylei 269.97]
MPFKFPFNAWSLYLLSKGSSLGNLLRIFLNNSKSSLLSFLTPFLNSFDFLKRVFNHLNNPLAYHQL